MARKNGREATRMKAISTISGRINKQVDTDNPKLTDDDTPRASSRVLVVVGCVEVRQWGFDSPGRDFGYFQSSDSMKSGLKSLPSVDSAVCKTNSLFLG